LVLNRRREEAILTDSIPEDFQSKVPWNVSAEGFEGPLDLLLFLIREHKMDIFNVRLMELTEGYLEFVRIHEQFDLELAGEFLVIASILVQYKLRALLPQELPQEEEEEEDDSELILRRLEEYKKFQEVADLLREKEQERASVYTRKARAEGYDEPDEVVFLDVDVYDLYSAFRRVLSEIGRDKPHVITGESFTVDEKIAEIILVMRETHQVNLIDHLRDLRSKVEVIVTFLALLECIRRATVQVRQAGKGGEIWMFRGEGWQDEG
jgi:segregation and condensation protein A